jgi:hypothetical protein
MASVADAPLSTVATTFGAAVLSNDETAPLERLAAIHDGPNRESARAISISRTMRSLSKLRAGLLRLAWERPTKRSRHHVAIGLLNHVGIAHKKLVKGCHDLAALYRRRAHLGNGLWRSD